MPDLTNTQTQFLLTAVITVIGIIVGASLALILYLRSRERRALA